MAVNCLVVPSALFGLVGVIAKDTSVAGVTVRVVDPEVLPDEAVIVVAPAATEVARPMEPEVLLIVAMGEAEDAHVTEEVRSCVVLSEKVPVATNCCFVFLTMPGLTGVMDIDLSVAGVTVTMVDPNMFPHFAVIFALPTPVAFVLPGLRSALELSVVDAENPAKCAISVVLVETSVESKADEVQVTDDVRSFVVLSE